MFSNQLAVSQGNRTFELFGVLHMDKTQNGQPPVKGNLIQYYLNGLKQPALYNGVQQVVNDLEEDFRAQDFNITGLPEEYVYESNI